MSDAESEEFGSAKDENYNASDADESEDEPLSKVKSSPKKKKSPPAKKAASPKKKKNNVKNKKSKRGRPSTKEVVNDPLAVSEKEEEEEYEVEAIVGHREYNGKLIYKIRWKNYEPIHDTWEDYESLSCPDLLEMYNTKHNVVVPKKKVAAGKKKRKSQGSPSKRTPKKRRGSVSDESEEETWEGDGDSEGEYEVDKIIEMRQKKNGTREFLVSWKRWSSEYDTWEPESNLNCPDIIERFLKRVENAKNANFKELRAERKHTDRFTLNTRDSGRRLSKRHNNKQRVSYYDAEGDDE